MKIIIDDKIPYIRGAFEPVARVGYLPGSKTTPADVRDAGALVTRTRTLCNEQLLKDSAVKFIATATIGYDHIDTLYCEKAGIGWTNAPGCNADSVVQYVVAALFSWALAGGITLRGLTIGVVGVGNVGSRVARLCELLDMRVLLNDPPRERAEGGTSFVSLETVRRESDILTLHVPLTGEGPDATHHLVDGEFLSGLPRKPLLINTCRGEVNDTGAVTEALEKRLIAGYIADCWENEPAVNPALVERAFLATPHIAGYSRDGKANGTRMSVRAVSRFFNLGLDHWEPSGVEPPAKSMLTLDGKGKEKEAVIAEAVMATYDIGADDRLLRNNPGLFEKYRGDYPVRREFPAYTLLPLNITGDTLRTLRKMGFQIQDNID